MQRGRQLRTASTFLLWSAIFLSTLLMAVDGKAADPAADYPTRQIEYVTHGAPGAALDLMGRMIGDIIQKEKILSQPLVVVNKVGSGGAVACGYVLERRGNPHMIMSVASGSFLVTPLMEKLPYDYKSFTPIANLLVDGSVLVVKSDSPFKTIDDIVAEARKRPKELIQGGASLTSNEMMMGRHIQKVKGVQWNLISFTSEPEALINLLNGNVHLAFTNPSVILDHVRAGKLRVLLAIAPNRYPEFKDAPTMKEAGVGEGFVTYRGIAGPPDMPEYAVRKLESTLKKVTDSDRFKKYAADTAMQPFWLNSQQYAKLLEEESNRWRAALSEVNLLKKK